jgi:ATP-dependent helicase/nuclease subunit A
MSDMHSTSDFKASLTQPMSDSGAPALSNDPSAQQRLASTPTISAWVDASAGSGKTKVLTDRMLRLLLPREDGAAGTRPDRILALTFTKAGANEMALRLSKRLADWAIFDDAKLAQDMEENLLGRPPLHTELKEARKLFARVVDTPGGLQIMTIHSFCQSILGRFPIEAGLTPGFSALDEGDAQEWLRQAAHNILSHAYTNPGSELYEAVQHLAHAMNEEQLEEFLKAFNGERNQAQRLLKEEFGAHGIYKKLCESLLIDQGQDIKSLDEQFFQHDHDFDLVAVCSAFANSKKESEQKNAGPIQIYWQSAKNERPYVYSSYKEIFLTSEGLPRKRLVLKDTATAYPDLARIMENEAQRIVEYEDKRKAHLCASFTRDAFLFGSAVMEEYKRIKDERGALDFEDLILKTLALLRGETFDSKGEDVIPWILFKLDEGLEHILVDEAQDTNPEQWEIIRLLSTEFFVGAGAHETNRTIFVVGDEKQSIFSFQRAAPDKFRDMFRWFDQKIAESGQSFVPVPINTSFRSVQVVLDAVDYVFANPETRTALSSQYLSHFAHRTGQAGIVEIWPLLRDIGGDDEDTKEEEQRSLVWDIPVEVKESQTGASQMATRIANQIRSWLDEGTILESYARPIEAGDILILVRSRGTFVPQLVRALKLRNIEVSGVDRMILSEQLVVEDLCAAADFALLPEDNLTLATLLKSPLIGYTEDQLYNLAHGRDKKSLWDLLRSSGDSLVISWLTGLIERAGNERPYEFFSRLIQAPCPADDNSGFHAIKRRLGEDAIDPLDEFLNLALSYEQKHTASLQSFLSWHMEGKSEIKRLMEEGGRAVRIMTVHGSKGLQAPIVFLPDTVRTSASKSDKILWPHKTGLNVPILYSAKASAPEAISPVFETIRKQEDEEYRRLLYVAMTRAEERLYIGGYTGKKAPKEDGDTVFWYKDIRTAFESLPNVQEVPSGILNKDGRDQPILRIESARTVEADKTKTRKGAITNPEDELPAYFRKMPGAEPVPPKPLVPSRPSEDEDQPAWSPLATNDPHRFRRGNITHKLLQTLPEVSADKRRTVATKFVSKNGAGLPQATLDGIVNETMAILEDPIFAPIFGAGSMAEIPVTGYLEEGTIISGQIDRMLVTLDEILIVDFKTNRPPPKNEADIQPIYRKQMRAYAKAIAKIYPGRKIRCALLWTDGPHLMEVNL